MCRTDLFSACIPSIRHQQLIPKGSMPFCFSSIEGNSGIGFDRVGCLIGFCTPGTSPGAIQHQGGARGAVLYVF